METTIKGHTLTARRNTRHGQEVPEHEFTTIGVRMCEVHRVRRNRRLWVMGDGENGLVYLRVGAYEFDVAEGVER